MAVEITKLRIGNKYQPGTVERLTSVIQNSHNIVERKKAQTRLKWMIKRGQIAKPVPKWLVALTREPLAPNRSSGGRYMMDTPLHV